MTIEFTADMSYTALFGTPPSAPTPIGGSLLIGVELSGYNCFARLQGTFADMRLIVADFELNDLIYYDNTFSTVDS